MDDSLMHWQEREIEFTLEFLNSIETTDLTPHYLQIKNNVMIMLTPM